MSTFNIFAYGSLMWNPGFTFQQAQLAQLPGYRRNLNVLTTEHRGTLHYPGLVFNLTPSEHESVTGVLYTISESDREEVIDYLNRRERITPMARYDQIEVLTDRGAAITYWVPPDSKHIYRDSLPSARIALAKGSSGSNLEYVERANDFLLERGVKDLDLMVIAGIAAKLKEQYTETGFTPRPIPFQPFLRGRHLG